MARHDDVSERELYRALIVDRYTTATWDGYLRRRSRADDGRDPATEGR
jgi:hypothetical protein